MAGKLLLGVGTLPAVPRKITRKLMFLHLFKHDYLSCKASVDINEMGF
jgi:hypothetical protein